MSKSGLSKPILFVLIFAIPVTVILKVAYPKIDRYLRQTPLDRCVSAKTTDIHTGEHECRIELGMPPNEGLEQYLAQRNQKKKVPIAPEVREELGRVWAEFESDDKLIAECEDRLGNDLAIRELVDQLGSQEFINSNLHFFKTKMLGVDNTAAFATFFSLRYSDGSLTGGFEVFMVARDSEKFAPLRMNTRYEIRGRYSNRMGSDARNFCFERVFDDNPKPIPWVRVGIDNWEITLPDGAVITEN
jgi:hypothetical protein